MSNDTKTEPNYELVQGQQVAVIVHGEGMNVAAHQQEYLNKGYSIVDAGDHTTVHQDILREIES